MHAFGYHSGFLRNTLTILCLGVLICLVWLFSAVFAVLRKKAMGEEA